LRRLLALGLLGGLSATALSAHAASPVWAAHGAHSTVYLAGSLHMLPANDATLPAAFDRAYADSAKLVMELDLGNFDPLEAMNWMMEHSALPSGSTLRSVLGQQRYDHLSTAAASLGLSMTTFEGQAPWVVGIEITEVAYTHQGFDPEQGVEEQLVRRAQSDGKPTAGLETLPEQLSGLIALSREDQVRMLDETVDELKDLKSETREVTDAWRHGDTTRLAALLSTEYNSMPSLYKPLVTDRNQRWLPEIEQMLKSSDNTLVVVGALHLVGPGGLLELLRKKGYRVTQLD
jgi:uncharacterized protein YbaP (TraB family)